jgi:hypothetical protein
MHLVMESISKAPECFTRIDKVISIDGVWDAMEQFHVVVGKYRTRRLLRQFACTSVQELQMRQFTIHALLPSLEFVVVIAENGPDQGLRHAMKQLMQTQRVYVVMLQGYSALRILIESVQATAVMTDILAQASIKSTTRTISAPPSNHPLLEHLFRIT